MPKYAGIKNKQICIISDAIFHNPNLEIVELPKELENVSLSSLILNYKYHNKKFYNKKESKNLKDLKLALVSNWKINCGIATYAEKLYYNIIPQLGDYKLFIEKNDFIEPINQIKDLTLPIDKVEPCWKRGEPLEELINNIKEYNPDIIWIQHEYGIWPNARYWLSLMTQLSEYRIITTMHSIFHHKDKTIVDASIPEIIVHLDGAKKVLEDEKEVSGLIYTIPHGCDPCEDASKLWNFYKSDHTFLQFGFGFRYKGFENCIKATAMLKEKYPDIFFTALFSEALNNEVDHQLYFNELKLLIEELKVQNNVALIKGFQSDKTLDSFIRTNQVCVFPYVSPKEHEVFGVTGAARVAMSKAIPIITFNGNHFSDIPSIKTNSPDEIAQELDKLFSDYKLIEKQIKLQLDYINKNSWENVAKEHIKIFLNQK